MMKLILPILCVMLNSTAAFADECDEVHTLALNIYHEARGEPHDGMLMVAEVTLNRVNHPAFPDTICEVVYQRSQFSWVTQQSNHTPTETEVWEESLRIARLLLDGDIEHLNTGATHFLNPTLVSELPRWARNFQEVGRVGNHVFYSM